MLTERLSTADNDGLENPRRKLLCLTQSVHSPTGLRLGGFSKAVRSCGPLAPHLPLDVLPLLNVGFSVFPGFIELQVRGEFEANLGAVFYQVLSFTTQGI